MLSPPGLTPVVEARAYLAFSLSFSPSLPLSFPSPFLPLHLCPNITVRKKSLVYSSLNLEQPISQPKIVQVRSICEQIVKLIFECTQLHNFMQRSVGPSSGIQCWTLCTKQTMQNAHSYDEVVCTQRLIDQTIHLQTLSYDVSKEGGPGSCFFCAGSRDYEPVSERLSARGGAVLVQPLQ